MAWSPHDDLHPPWFPGKKKTNDLLKFDDKNKKLEKTNVMVIWPPQGLLKGTSRNYELTTIIDKSNDHQVLCILIDLHHGSFDAIFHDSKMGGWVMSYKC